MRTIRTWGAGILLGLLGAAWWAQAADAPPKGPPTKPEREVFKKDLAGNAEVEKIIQTFGGRGEVGDNTPPTPAVDALKLFQTTE